MRSILLNWIYKQRKSVLWRELSPECETCISQTNKLNSCQIIWKPHPCFGRCKSLQCCNFQKDTTVWGRSSTVPKRALQTRSPSQNSLQWLIHSVPGPLMGPFVSVGELAPITCSSIGGCGMLPAISKLLLQWPQRTPTDLHARASILGGWGTTSTVNLSSTVNTELTQLPPGTEQSCAMLAQITGSGAKLRSNNGQPQPGYSKPISLCKFLNPKPPVRVGEEEQILRNCWSKFAQGLLVISSLLTTSSKPRLQKTAGVRKTVQMSTHTVSAPQWEQL